MKASGNATDQRTVFLYYVALITALVAASRLAIRMIGTLFAES